MPSDTVTCPSCGTTLKPKTPVAGGTRLKCPKCANVFATPSDEGVAAPPPSPARTATQDSGYEDSTEGVDAPAGERDAPIKAKKKKGIPLWVWLVSGGGIVLLLTCCGCGIGGYMFVNSVANAGSGSVTLINYSQIQKDASEAQVKTILGEPAERDEKGNTKKVTWRSGSDVIIVDFIGDKATERTCHLTNSSGLKIDQTGFVGK